jgi:hypothetical protein
MYTAGELKQMLYAVPDDYQVVYQRIEDVYFEEHGWDKSVIKTPSDVHCGIDNDMIPAFQAFQWPEFKILVITAHY